MPLSKPNYKRFIPLGLFLLGILSAVILSFKNGYWSITSADYESLRCFFLQCRISALDTIKAELDAQGIYLALSWFLDHNSAYYLYLSYLANAFNFDSGKTFLVVQYTFIVFLMGVFPTLIYKITNNVKIALISIVLFFCMSHIAPASMFQINDCYWAYYLIIAIGMPVLYILITNKWSASMWYYTFLLSFTIAVCNTARSNAGIFFWIALLGIVIYKNIPNVKAYLKATGVAGAYDIFVILSFAVTLSHYLALRKENIKLKGELSC